MTDPIVLHWFPIGLAQIFRGFCIIVGPFCIILCAQLAYRSHMPNVRRWNFTGMGFLLAASTYTEIVRWNDDVSPRLFIIFFGTIASLIGLLKMYKHWEENYGS